MHAFRNRNIGMVVNTLHNHIHTTHFHLSFEFQKFRLVYIYTSYSWMASFRCAFVFLSMRYIYSMNFGVECLWKSEWRIVYLPEKHNPSIYLHLIYFHPHNIFDSRASNQKLCISHIYNVCCVCIQKYNRNIVSLTLFRCNSKHQHDWVKIRQLKKTRKKTCLKYI